MEFFDGIAPSPNTGRVWTSFANTVAAFFFFSFLHFISIRSSRNGAGSALGSHQNGTVSRCPFQFRSHDLR